MQKYGIMVMSGFAALWCVWGLSAISPVPAAAMLVPLVISGVLIAFAARMPVYASPQGRRDIGRIIGWAAGLEFVAILAANTALGATGHAGYAVCATAGIVGLHFLPLAHLLRVRSYYVSGAALVTLATASAAIGDDHTRLLTLGLGAAVLLWVTCLTAFSRKTDERFLAA
jgi:hypothetical protein